MYTKYKYDVTTLSVSSYDRKVSIEIPMDSTSHEVFEAFKALMVGMSFDSKSFDDAVVTYFYEHELDKSNE